MSWRCLGVVVWMCVSCATEPRRAHHVMPRMPVESTFELHLEPAHAGAVLSVPVESGGVGLVHLDARVEGAARVSLVVRGTRCALILEPEAGATQRRCSGLVFRGDSVVTIRALAVRRSARLYLSTLSVEGGR